MESKKGLLKCISMQLLITVIMAFLFHYVWKELSTSPSIPEFTFSKSMAMAIFFKLAFYSPSILNNKK